MSFSLAPLHHLVCSVSFAQEAQCDLKGVTAEVHSEAVQLCTVPVQASELEAWMDGWIETFLIPWRGSLWEVQVAAIISPGQRHLPLCLRFVFLTFCRFTDLQTDF